MKSTGSVKLEENSSQMKLEQMKLPALMIFRFQQKVMKKETNGYPMLKNTGKSVLCARKKQKKQIMFMSTKLILSAKSADMNEP